MDESAGKSKAVTLKIVQWPDFYFPLRIIWKKRNVYAGFEMFQSGPKPLTS